MIRKQFQAKQITDHQIVLAVNKCQDATWPTNGAEICSLFPSIPSNVVKCKLRQAILKKLVVKRGLGFYTERKVGE